MKRAIGNLFIVFGLISVIGAGGLFLYNYLDAKRAADASAEILRKLDEEMAKDNGTDEDQDPVDEIISDEARAKYTQKAMPTETIDGQRYIGKLEIPSLGLTLPVMENWDYERLKISPCRYSGSYYYDDLVICAHNYARHFSPIKWIGIGVEVNFINVKDEVYRYKTSNIETVDPVSVDDMIKNTHNDKKSKKDWDMTLFTCNTGGQTRCAVRCVRVDRDQASSDSSGSGS
ncbi:MAG: sortase [Lachnospiraceae bacterium]|nr:sortase [Lachnospiraceae bacterium]